MEAANLHKSPRPTTAGPGDLVLQNGKQAGARRPLGAPTTFIGRGKGCDIRLNVDGVDALHCLLVVADTGVQLRDLNSVHGTYVNGSRADNVPLEHGDVVKVGPFQFRVELSADFANRSAAPDELSSDDQREALRIQAAAVAAQQIGLEEEEARLQQRRSDLQQQEEQLAGHLAEKQRQVQLWSDYTKAERDTLRKEKLGQEKRLDKLEQELLQARQEVGKDHQKLTLERQRIHKVYQRLRQRWQRQWSAEKEKHQKHAKRLQAEALTLDERLHALQTREAALTQDVLRFNTERELGTRQLREARATLQKDQESWRRRRRHEFLVLKGMQRQSDQGQLKLKQARLLLIEEKDAWDKQLNVLQKELHGLNNRIVHQRLRIEEQTAESARFDTLLRQRRLQVKELPEVAAEIVSDDDDDDTLLECEVIVVAEESAPAEAPVLPTAPADALEHRCADLDRLVSDLADQRNHLLEQYKHLAEIQEAWQRQRDQTGATLESLAQRLLDKEHSLTERDQHSAIAQEMLRRRQQEIDTLRAEMQIARAELKLREQTFAEEHEKQLHAVQQQETTLQEQFAALTALRQRWNQRRQQEMDQLRSNHAALAQLQRETHQRREALFEKGLRVEEEKRILAEKALALEQYRQEVFIRAKDPAAQRRVERLRRRWLTLNAALIRNAKAERDATRKDLAKLEAQRCELTKSMEQMTEQETSLGQQQSQVEEQETLLMARQALVEQELRKLESQRQQSQEQHLRLQDEIDTLATAVYAESDAPAIDKAA